VIGSEDNDSMSRYINDKQMSECVNRTQMPPLKKTGVYLQSRKSDKFPNKLGLHFMVIDTASISNYLLNY
jgi:hypothetical protein